MCYGLLLEDLNNLILVTIAMKKIKKISVAHIMIFLHSHPVYNRCLRN